MLALVTAKSKANPNQIKPPFPIQEAAYLATQAGADISIEA